MGNFVNLTSADGFSAPAWVAVPEGPVRGAIVVLQEIFGVNSHIQAVTDRFAARGYVAVAPSLFARVQPDVDLGYAPADMERGMALKAATEALPAPGAMAEVQAAIAHAAAISGGKVGIVGFCWGGLMTWRAACTLPGLAAAVAYYGGGMTTPAEVARAPQCPVLAHFARQDHWISVDSVQAFGPAGRHADSIDAVVAALRTARPASILVKGSRSMKMERVIAALRVATDPSYPVIGGPNAA